MTKRGERRQNVNEIFDPAAGVVNVGKIKIWGKE
jgi:hypothetical protein